MKNPKAKGSRRERQVRDMFLEYGYDVIKGGGSLGVFDLVCVLKEPVGLDLKHHVIGIQVKSTCIGPLEVQKIADHVTWMSKQIWIKKDRKPWKFCVIEDRP